MEDGSNPVRGRAKSFQARAAGTGQPAGLGDGEPASSVPSYAPASAPPTGPGLGVPRTAPPTLVLSSGNMAAGEPMPPDAGLRELAISPSPSWDTRSLDNRSESGRSETSNYSRSSGATRTTGAPVGFDRDRKKGVKGRVLDVVTNFVAMEDRSNHTIKQYRVDFTPPEDQTYLKKQLMSIHERKLGKFIFDGAMLYINDFIDPANHRLQSSFQGSAVHEVVLRYVGEIDSDDPTYIQFYNTVFRKCLGIMKLDELGRHFFDSSKLIKIDKAPLELWPGYITAIKKHDAGVLLCIEATHKVLRTTSVLDMIKTIIAQNRDHAAAQAEVRKQILGQIVITHYNKKTYRIDEIDFDSTPAALFSTNSGGVAGETSYVDYYRERYGIMIPESEQSQPLLVSHPRKKDINKGMRTNIYLIPSLCNLTGLSDAQRKDFRLMQSMSDHLHMDPATRKAKLQDFMESMRSNRDVSKEFQNWNVVFNPEFLKAKARALNPEEIHVKTRTNTDTFLLPDTLADWTTLLKRNYMLDRKELTQWILYVHTDHKLKSPKLLQGMREQATALGMRMDEPLAVVTYGGSYNSKLNEKDLMTPLSLHRSCKFVVFVLPNNQLGRYTQVKKFFVLQHGIPIQCLLEKNIENKNFNAIMSKMMIQVNAKLGGVPWSVKVPFKTRVMILGYDVYHCAERKNESVGALVATLSPNLGTYFSVVSFHKDKSELSDNMCLDTKKCLEAFKMANGELPERILLFRDGVGEGQIKFVVEHEVRMMEAGIIEIYQKAGIPKPKFTFIVVTKKINNRFMTSNQMGRVCNPPPGTVLDEVMTIPGRYDFFLVSQSVRQGTVSPTSYNVIYDNSGLSADSIQQLSYKLCHLYFNWSGTVAVPAPCQFAHKLAYLTGVALCKEAPTTLHNVLWYL